MKLFALRVRISQQVEIAAAHEFEAAADEANGAIAQLVGLPAGTSWNAGTPEQALRKDAIALARQAAVDGPEREAEPVTTLVRQTLGRAALWPPHDDAPQAQRGVGARGEVRVERDDDRSRRRRACAAHEHHGQPGMALIDEPIAAVSRTAFKRWCNRGEATRVRETFRRRYDENGAGVEMRQPDDGSSIRSQVRIDRETGAPSGVSLVRESWAGRPDSRRPLGSRADSRDCV